jgi:lipopolysaccharide export system permease protein
MRLLHRYILKELVLPFFVALTLISFLLLMNRLLTLVDLVLEHGVSFFVVLKLITYVLPATFAITVPMSLLIAVLIALGRLAGDLELVALRASGLSLLRLLLPLAVMGLILSFSMLAFNEYVLPGANLSYKVLFYDIVSKRSNVALQEKAYVKDFEGLIIYVGDKDPNGEILRDLTILKPAQDKEPLQWIRASWGRVISEKTGFKVYLDLHDGTVHFLNGPQGEDLTQVLFQQSRVDLDIGGALKQLQGQDRQPQEMSLRDIAAETAKMPDADQRRWHWMTEFHKKIAIPFACLTFVLAGFPLGTLTRKGGRLLGFSFAIGLIFLYYLLLSLGQTYGDSGRLAPALAMWMPNIGMMILAAGLSWMVFKERGIFTFARV